VKSVQPSIRPFVRSFFILSSKRATIYPYFYLFSLYLSLYLTSIHSLINPYGLNIYIAYYLVYAAYVGSHFKLSLQAQKYSSRGFTPAKFFVYNMNSLKLLQIRHRVTPFFLLWITLSSSANWWTRGQSARYCQIPQHSQIERYI
jgi:hypothetical protein